jgi:hypothetical protein
MRELKLNMERFQKTIDFLKTLPHHQFDYSMFIAKHHELPNGEFCGTTCCVAGWVPKIFGAEAPYTFGDMLSITPPAIQLRSYKDKDNLTEQQLLIANDNSLRESWGCVNVMIVKLIDFYGFNSDKMVSALFYGNETTQQELDLPITRTSIFTTLRDVIILFETFLENYKAGIYDVPN